jgi:tetratricopeptide (TPR) repeat protein
VRTEAQQAVGRAKTVEAPQRAPGRRTPKVTQPVLDELSATAGPSTAPKLGQRLGEATRAFERERYAEARKLLTPLAQRAPGSPAVRELLGLTLYRLGKWTDAARELENFIRLTGSTEQHPVLADCYRALRRYAEVDRLWEELRAASPSAALVTEGRIVHAGSLADQGDVPGAIAQLEAGWRNPRRPQAHHLRLLYSLADLYERAGDVPRSRATFARIAQADPDFADVPTRLRALGAR